MNHTSQITILLLTPCTKKRDLIIMKKMKKPCFHLMNRFNSLKHVQDFDADNSNNKKRKKRKKKKYSVRNFFVICAT